jgi:hypothetical protein
MLLQTPPSPLYALSVDCQVSADRAMSQRAFEASLPLGVEQRPCKVKVQI